MKAYKRTDRIDETLKREIAGMLERMEFHPEKCLVSISDVHVSGDLRHAKVFISVLGGSPNAKAKVLRLLGGKRREIQDSVSKHVVLKYTPVLEFIIDESLEKGDRILSIISELEKNEDLAP